MNTDTMIHPETGEMLYRDIRPHEFRYKGESIILNSPGWYPADNDNGIFSQEDMQITITALKILKERVAQREKVLKSA